MRYDTRSGKWTNLQLYKAKHFAMTVIHNQLVLVGGIENGLYSRVLCVWRADSKEWTHPYPEMPTGRLDCSAVVYYNEWLVVAGGKSISETVLSSVDVMNTDNKQWCTVFC